ncbi:MAG: bifunctional diaminohydroxyphosphoribosylaminopyrimidine deaminase/5-amino-6-(5-phosphoribosylamino)uracil reductase RibD [Proteobacteria bacterium]|nr:bifunctional diaminohydroxyphosphoribosylaminopyrimidine deaminase/5-amino-6-(5-phosphoribosylamino)uracil reductase RibD [Pseudomonadota bacterium]MBU1710190.1 bifunctional diaminohydroxyphosphoribosylaminopyrimidine deaminase/5-amino-6-(5-phosphoribosylamino)uracil reductase RibD [Pseudomonadota bacterium]
MKLALREAAKGIGKTSPNPCVGAVVVRGGKVVGKGYHRKAGTPHAEVNALRAAGELARGATIYVTLEPCNHTGRTPPCTKAILESGIKRVVVGMPDPNPQVKGGGCDFLTKKGLSVTSGVLEEECRAINRPFIKHIQTGLPWVILKAGCSLDGRIAVANGQSGWITNDQSRAEVHRVRNRVDAILIGVGTVLADDPSLTARLPNRRGKDPLRVILDTQLRMPPQAKMLKQRSAAATWIFCGKQYDKARRNMLEDAGAIVRPVRVTNGRLDLTAVLEILGSQQLTSVLVEGGSKVHGSFLRADLIDQALIFLAPILIGSDGIPLIDTMGLQSVQNARRFKTIRTRRFGDDIMIDALVNQDFC